MTEYSIGIDIGGTKIAGGIVSKEGNVIHHQVIRTPREGRKQVIATLIQLISSLMDTAKDNQVGIIKGIGIGTAGQVEFTTGTIISGTSNILNWNQVPLKEELLKHFSIPIWIDNDVNVVALGEKHLGLGYQDQNMICLTLGTGVGGGVISNGELLHGAWGGAAELGHTTVNMYGPKCNCGSRGCLETYASGTGIANRMKEKILKSTAEQIHLPQYEVDPQKIDSRLVFEWYQEGNPFAIEVIEEMIEALSFSIVNFIHTFNPTLVVLGGGVMTDREWLCEKVETRILQLGIGSLVRPVKVRMVNFREYSAVIGASYQVWI